MKTEISNYFKNDRSHAAGVQLVMKHSNRLALKKQVNIHPESDYMTGVIHQELGELAGMSTKELRDLLKTPIVKIPVSEQSPGDPPVASVIIPAVIGHSRKVPAEKKPDAGKKASLKK